MINYNNISYNSYLNMKETLSFEDMQNIYEKIILNADSTNEDFNDLWAQIIDDSCDYAKIRSNWSFMSKEERQNKDSSRTSTHNSILNDFIALERIFKKNSWNSDAWTKPLFLKDYRENRKRADINEHRKRIGDFSIYLVFIYAINGR